MKYVMYGKGIVWNAMVKLLEYMNYDFTQMDDIDRDDDVLDSVDKIIITAWISPKHEIYIKYHEHLTITINLYNSDAWNKKSYCVPVLILIAYTGYVK